MKVVQVNLWMLVSSPQCHELSFSLLLSMSLPLLSKWWIKTFYRQLSKLWINCLHLKVSISLSPSLPLYVCTPSHMIISSHTSDLLSLSGHDSSAVLWRCWYKKVSLTHGVTRSPIELSLTAKNNKILTSSPQECRIHCYIGTHPPFYLEFKSKE